MYITLLLFMKIIGFPTPTLSSLSSLFNTFTRWLMMQKVRCHPIWTPTACKLLISGSISLPFSGFFSPFPRGTCSLSVRITYLEIRGWYPVFQWMITSPTCFLFLRFYRTITFFGVWFIRFQIVFMKYFSFSLSLATTNEISFDFFSSSY